MFILSLAVFRYHSRCQYLEHMLDDDIVTPDNLQCRWSENFDQLLDIFHGKVCNEIPN